MHTPRFQPPLGAALAAAVLSLVVASAHAQTAGAAVSVDMTLQKVATSFMGQEVLKSAETSSPGDVLEYKAVYKNVSVGPLSKVNATMPVPKGTSFVAGTAIPPVEMASLDGVKYEPVPLKRTVRDEATGNGDFNDTAVLGTFTYTSSTTPMLTQSITVVDRVMLDSATTLSLVKTMCDLGTSWDACATLSEFTPFEQSIAPGQDLIYRNVYLNSSSAPMNAFKIFDITPAYTTFVSASMETLPAGLTACRKTTPASATAVDCATTQAAGGTGSVLWEFTGSLGAGQTSAVRLQVHVNP